MISIKATNLNKNSGHRDLGNYSIKIKSEKVKKKQVYIIRF